MGFDIIPAAVLNATFNRTDHPLTDITTSNINWLSRHSIRLLQHLSLSSASTSIIQNPGMRIHRRQQPQQLILTHCKRRTNRLEHLNGMGKVALRRGLPGPGNTEALLRSHGPL